MTNTTIVIIGGGYIGVVTAIHLARYSQQPLNICIIETSSSLGEGVAFGTGDKDHRLNGPSGIQFLYPENYKPLLPSSQQITHLLLHHSLP